MKEMKFYSKTEKTESIVDLIVAEAKLKINWDLIKNGADVNKVFKANPVGLDEFLKDDINKLTLDEMVLILNEEAPSDDLASSD